MDEIVVETKNGAVRGERTGPVARFLGVPFASSPTGPRRFRAPEPVGGWSQVRDATSFGPVAMQVPTVLEIERGMPSAMSEDCLTLNVWSPAAAPRGDVLPVLFWIHGGSFLNGSGSMAWFDGWRLASRGDVVVVTVNYRLGVFGYLDLAAIGGERSKGCTNAGLLDQVAALVWVRDNIGAFGGDPGRVCLVGESAGAMSIGTLLSTSAAAGLFHRAILQSGTPVAQPRQSAAALTAHLLDALGLPQTADGVGACFDLDASAILHAASEVSGRMMAAAAQPGRRTSFMWSPVIDGTVVEDDPWASIGAGASSAVPVMIGTTRDEMRIVRRLFADRPPVTEGQLEAMVGELFGERAGEALAAYAELHRGAPTEDLFDAIASDRIFTVPTAEFIDRRAASGAPTWTYRFDWKSTAEGGRYGAAHTVEIPFLFDTFDAPGVAEFLGPLDGAATQLARCVQDAWVSFAADGVPLSPGLPEWPAWTDGDRRTMVLDTECRAVTDPSAAVRSIWGWATS